VVAESANVAGLAEDPGGDDRTGAGQVHQGAAGLADHLLETGLELGGLPVDRGDPVQPAAQQLDPDPGVAVQQPAGGADLGRSGQLRHLVLVAGRDDDQVGVDPVDQPDPFGDQLTPVSLRIRSCSVVSSVHRAATRSSSQVVTLVIARASIGSDLPPPARRRRSRTVNPHGTSRTSKPTSTSHAAAARAKVPGPFDADPRHPGVRQPLAQPQVTSRVVGERVDLDLATRIVDDRHRQCPLV
jgi:hypothetical protein